MTDTQDTIRVLHVDDEPAFLELAAEQLARESDRIRVSTATAVDEALDVLAAEPVDCVVADYDMPDRTGIDLLEVVRADRPGLPFVLFTGKGSEEIASRAISVGVTDYLQKRTGPEQFALLANRIENAVESERAKTAVERSRERLHSLSEAFPDIAFFVDEDGRYLEVLAGDDSRLLADDAESLVGRQFHDVFPPETADRFLDTVERTLATGERQTMEYELDVAVGRRWFEARTAPIDTKRSDRGVVVIVARDVTERSERERKIRALHEQTRRLLVADDRATVAELVVDAASDILGFDTNAVRLLDGSGTILEPVAVSDATLDNLGERPDYTIGEGGPGDAFERGELLVYDDVRERDDGIDLGPVRSAMYLPIGEYGVVSITDTTVGSFDESDLALAEILVANAEEVLRRLDREHALAERESELRRKNERLDDFASIVSHDLRSPVNVLDGHLDLVRADCESHHLDTMQQSIDRMESLIDDLLTLAREGDAVDEVDPVDLADLVGACWETVETDGADLVVETDTVVPADPSRLRQAVENLLRNAVEHGSTSPPSQAQGDAVEHGSTSPGSQARQDAVEQGSTSSRTESGDAVENSGVDVTITVGDLDGGDGFYVADDGPGIPESERERVFESGYSTAPEGTGLGLAIVQGVVEAHDWEVRATESVDGGARFEIAGVERAD